MMRNALKAGFTLIELLVTLILLGLLTAVVFPVVVQQIDEAEPTKAANDLANIKTGIEVFHLNVRPKWPGDLEDLVHEIDGTTPADADITNTAFLAGNEPKWNGPYIDAAIAEGTAITAIKETGDAVTSGWGFQIQNDLICYDAGGNLDNGSTCAVGTHFIAMKILGASIDLTAVIGSEGSEFAALDALIDNSDGKASGKIRALDGVDATNDSGDEIIYYLVAPYTN